MVLFNAVQSSTSSSKYPASNAIDGDWNTASITADATGTQWLQVSMTNTIVDQIELRAYTPSGEEITVSLYSGKTLAGQCKSHSGGAGGWASRETLSCAKVTADRIKLTMRSTSKTRLSVYEIHVTGNNQGYNITRCSITKLSSKPLKK